MAHNYTALVVAIFCVLLNYCAVFCSTWSHESWELEYVKKLNNTLQQCVEEYNTSIAKIQLAMMSPDGNNGDNFQCVWACYFKKLDIIDDKGMYDVIRAKESLSKMMKNEKKREDAFTIAKTCERVNHKSVSDGAAGCDRSELLVECIMQEILLESFKKIHTVLEIRW